MAKLIIGEAIDEMNNKTKTPTTTHKQNPTRGLLCRFISNKLGEYMGMHLQVIIIDNDTHSLNND